ncbi:MAG: alpha/beta fold hydrolase [Gemmatimonadota bacterium]|nr:MAG: alpha/beta fold hydrolase [Gemmatimonadota bacterium]
MRRVLPVVLLLTLGCSRGPLDVKSGYVDVEGARLYYEEAGQGTPLVMIHGGFLDRRMWDDQFQAFARRNRVIRYDVRAHGLSQSDSVAFADHEDLLSLMEALHVPSAAIIGLSMGGGIAADFALAHPERVSALVLVGPGLSGYSLWSEEVASYVEQLTAALETGDFSAVTETFARWWCDGPHRTPSQVDPAVRQRVLDMLAGSGQRWRYYGLARPLDPPAIERLGDINVPTLAVVGSIDVSDVLEIVDIIAERVPGARKVVIPDVAHMVSMEKPEEFNRVVLEFLSRL